MEQFGLNLLFQSPKAYRFLREVLHLPHVRTLGRWLADIPMTPGIIPGAMDITQYITKDWPIGSGRSMADGSCKHVCFLLQITASIADPYFLRYVSSSSFPLNRSAFDGPPFSKYCYPAGGNTLEYRRERERVIRLHKIVHTPSGVQAPFFFVRANAHVTRKTHRLNIIPFRTHVNCSKFSLLKPGTTWMVRFAHCLIMSSLRNYKYLSCFNLFAFP
ncbi:hypothetical protein HPB51_011663 [Rhipicephalus microplus]|uniref:THAP9-like helix-turn-helix domain-containing protein n=1 Tax=Rhipicephalus microplus TaxID=6941 RepID=A0A9J6ETB1_RHIMP|nr:hypothetical protein HPB51_011663 [Rhipicephalus microplus]